MAEWTLTMAELGALSTPLLAYDQCMRTSVSCWPAVPESVHAKDSPSELDTQVAQPLRPAAPAPDYACISLTAIALQEAAAKDRR